LERGEPWFYVSLATRSDGLARLERIARTEAIDRYIAHISSAATSTSRAIDVISGARKERPAKLLPAKDEPA
jgi:hypothetical protein